MKLSDVLLNDNGVVVAEMFEADTKFVFEGTTGKHSIAKTGDADADLKRALAHWAGFQSNVAKREGFTIAPQQVVEPVQQDPAAPAVVVEQDEQPIDTSKDGYGIFMDKVCAGITFGAATELKQCEICKRWSAGITDHPLGQVQGINGEEHGIWLICQDCDETTDTPVDQRVADARTMEITAEDKEAYRQTSEKWTYAYDLAGDRIEDMPYDSQAPEIVDAIMNIVESRLEN